MSEGQRPGCALVGCLCSVSSKTVAKVWPGEDLLPPFPCGSWWPQVLSGSGPETLVPYTWSFHRAAHHMAAGFPPGRWDMGPKMEAVFLQPNLRNDIPIFLSAIFVRNQLLSPATFRGGYTPKGDNWGLSKRLPLTVQGAVFLDTKFERVLAVL